MGHSSNHTDRNPLAPSLVDHFIDLTHAKRSDHITIACRGHSSLSLDLCRRGFAHVDWMCVDQAGIHDDTDILWLPFVGDHQHLEAALDRFARWVRPGGIAVVHDLPDTGSVTQHTFLLRQVLHHHGFAAMVQEPHPVCGFSLAARKFPHVAQVQPVHATARGAA